MKKVVRVTKPTIIHTIQSREGRIFASIMEVRSIVDDCRMKTVGGTLAGMEIWELALIPAILNNSETWTDMDDTAIAKLNKMQNTMCRILLSIPITTLAPFILWDLGVLIIEIEIFKRS